MRTKALMAAALSTAPIIWPGLASAESVEEALERMAVAVCSFGESARLLALRIEPGGEPVGLGSLEGATVVEQGSDLTLVSDGELIHFSGTSAVLIGEDGEVLRGDCIPADVELAAIVQEVLGGPDVEDARQNLVTEVAELEQQNAQLRRRVSELDADLEAAHTPAELTEAERDAFRVAIQGCWNVGSLSSEAMRTVVTVVL